MKPAPFGYLAPTSVGEATALLAQYGDEAKILAGGQSLVPLLNMRLAQPRYLVDINRCAELAYIRDSHDYLAIGALARQRQVEASVLVGAECPLAVQALRHVGHLQVRHRGTFCGSIAHADPSSELPAVLLALGGSVVLRGPDGERTVAAEDFFVTYLTTAAAADELVTEVRLPKLPIGSASAFLELARRHGDFAIVGVACASLPDGSFRLGLAGVGPGPIRPREAEAALVAGEIDEAAELAARAADPEDDFHASAEYRRDMVRVFVRRAARKVVESRG